MSQVITTRVNVGQGQSATLVSGATYTCPPLDGNGGAVNNEEGTVTGGDVVFSGNTAKGGVAICSKGGTLAFSGNVDFRNNFCANGSVLCLQTYLTGQGASATFSGDVSFSGNTAGALSCSYSTINFAKSVSFTGNTYKYAAAAIYSDSSTITVAGNADFSFNVAGLNAGAIYNSKSGRINFNGASVSFSGNTASKTGGAIFNSSSNSSAGIVTVSGDADFSLNVAGETGGAIFNSGTIDFAKDVTFSGNTAGINGGAINNYTGGTISFAGSTTSFSGNTATKRGGAIFNQDTMTVSGDADFSLNVAGETGGAIYNNGGTINFTGATTSFSGNTVESSNSNGGAIYNDHGSISFASNSVRFTGNFAINGGAISNNAGTITVTGSIFSNNTAGNKGGAISNKSGTINFTGATTSFTGNTAASSYGGAIYNQNGLVTVSGDADFAGNVASNNGGAIYNNGGTINFSGATTSFTGNTAFSGGAIFNKDTINFTGATTSFTGNTAADSGYGGAISNSSDGTISFAGDADFTGNSAGNSGGAIYNNYGSISFAGATTSFIGNTVANVNGGAIYNSGSVTVSGNADFSLNVAGETGGAIYNKGTMSFTGASVSFSGNTAKNGGAIKNDNGTMTISGNADFAGNVASQNGGAIYNGGTINLSGESVSFTGNTAGTNGGAINNDGGTVTISGDADFAGNVASSSGGAINNSTGGTISFAGSTTSFSGNTAGYGAAIFNRGTLVFAGNVDFRNNLSSSVLSFQSGSSATFSGDVSFSGNTGVGLQTSGSMINFAKSVSFTGNTAKSGSAIYNSNSTIITVAGNADFTGNTATSSGGAIYNRSGSVNFTGATTSFTGNTASKTGGAIYNTDTVTISGDADFSLNVAGETGGAIYNNGGSISFAKDVTFTGNSASDRGGAIFNGNTTTISGNADFTGNTAEDGGAIYSWGTVNFNGASVSFTGNTATGRGGAIFNLDGTVKIDGNVNFTGNTAAGQYGVGGAICNKNDEDCGVIIISGNADFSNNTGPDGGAIYNEGTINFNGASVSFTGNTATGTSNGGGGAICNWGTVNLKGAMTLATASDTVFNGGTFNWDLTGATAACITPVVENYQYFTNDASYGGKLSITVAEGIMYGEYVIATGDFSNLTDNEKTFTVTGLAGKEDVTISVGGGRKEYGDDYYYSLKVDSGSAFLSNDDKLVLVVQSAIGCDVNPEYANKWFTSGSNITVYGTLWADDIAEFTFGGETITNYSLENGTWNYTIPTTLGDTKGDDYEIYIEDMAGNTAGMTYKVKVDTVAPTVSGTAFDNSTDVYYDASGKAWFKQGDNMARLNAIITDETSGVDNTDTTYNGAQYDGTGFSIDTSEETDYNNTISAYDVAGNRNWNVNPGAYGVDGTAPTSDISVSGAYEAGDGVFWVKQGVETTVSAVVTDDRSGVKEVVFSGGATITGIGGTYSAAYATTQQHYLSGYNIKAEDNVGNYDIAAPSIGVDGTPVTLAGETLSITGDNVYCATYPQYWVKAGTDFIIGGTVTDILSGVKESSVTLNGETLTRGDNDFFSHTWNVSEESDITDWEFFANDNVGNEYSTTVIAIGVDGTGPEIGETTITGTNVSGNWIKAGTNFSVVTEITDAKSDLDTATLEDVTYAGGSFAMTAGEDGDLADHTIFAIDNVGNTSTKAVNYGFDGSEPTVDAIYTSDFKAASWYRDDDYNVWVRQGDTLSVIANITDGKSGLDYANAVSASGATIAYAGGSFANLDTSTECAWGTRYNITATDNVGNVNTEATLKYGVDGTGPAITLKDTVTATVCNDLTLSGAPDSANVTKTTDTVNSGADMADGYTSKWFSAVDTPFVITIADQILTEVTINGATQTLSGTSFDYTFEPEQGENVYEIVATDGVGNQTTTTITLNYDSEAPVFEEYAITVEGIDYTGFDFASAKDNPVSVSDIENFNVSLNVTDKSELVYNYTFSADGTTWSTWTTFTDTTSFTTGEGYYRFAAVDEAGNSAIADKYFYIGRQIEYTLSDAVDVIYDGEEHGISVTITDPEGGVGASVYYSIDGGETWTLTENGAYMLTDVTDGKVSVCFKLTALHYCDTYTESTTIKIDPKRLFVSGTTADNKTYDGTADAVVHAGTLSGIVEGDDVVLNATGHWSSANAGNKTVTADYTLGGADGGNYKTVVSESISAYIYKRQVTLESASDSKEYDGTPLTNDTVTALGEGWIEGEGATYNVTGSQTLVGSSANTFDYTLNDNTSADNYFITKQYGTLEVTKPVPVPRAAGDLDGNGLADIVMTIDQSTHPHNGATGAWLIQDDQTAAWGDLSTRNEGWTIFGTGWSSNKATADVYVKSDENVVGAWVTDGTGAVTGWKTVGSFDADTQILGLGDFNNDGWSDLLLRNTNGAVGCYLTDGTGWNYFQSLGDEWEIAAIGDLNGDGTSDIVLRHEAGFAGSWLTQADGTVKWADLDTLSSDIRIVGCGDFNGDGTDDVLLTDGSNYGAWLVKDGSAADWMGLGEFDAAVEGIADYNGDGIDDLRIRTDNGDLGALLVVGEDSLDWKYYGSVGDEWNTKLASL